MTKVASWCRCGGRPRQAGPGLPARGRVRLRQLGAGPDACFRVKAAQAGNRCLSRQRRIGVNSGQGDARGRLRAGAGDEDSQLDVRIKLYAATVATRTASLMCASSFMQQLWRRGRPGERSRRHG